MEIVAGQLDWTSIDEENLSKFLDTPTGKRFLPKLLESCPSLSAGGEINQILIRTGEVRGYQRVGRDILSLAHPSNRTEPNVAESYPSPEDDSKWEDGNKMTPNPVTE